jgi:hypothetical protein
VLAGICSGVILGTKFSGILDGLAVGALLVLAVWRGAPDGTPGIKTGVKSALRGLSVPLVAFFLSTMFYGAYPLIRNAVIEGNPIAPVEVKIGTWTMWPGKSASDFPSIGSEEVLEKAGNGGELFYLIWFEKFQLFFDPNNSGSGPIWLFLGIPGAVLWIGQSFRKRNGPAIAISVLSVMILLLTPAQWRPRYVLSLLLICGLGAALLVESLRAGPKRAVLSLLALSAAYVTVITLRPSPVEPEKAMAYVFRSDDLQRNAGSAQPDNEFFQWVEERTRSSPAVIVYGRWVDSYPLFGADLRNTVISLAANSAETWDRQLAERAVELVVTAAGSPEEAWTRDSGDYTEVFRYDSWAVWERN